MYWGYNLLHISQRSVPIIAFWYNLTEAYEDIFSRGVEAI